MGKGTFFLPKKGFSPREKEEKAFGWGRDLFYGGDILKRKWLEVTFVSERDFLPHLEGILISKKIKKWIEEEREGKVFIKIYIPYFEGVEGYITSLKGMVKARTQIVVKDIEGKDWSLSWKRFFKVEKVGDIFVLKPPWEKYVPKEGEKVIEMEPRMSFGTGYHPTTRLTLLLIEKFVREGMDVLDVGCGSGILTIASSLMGAKRVVGVDNDGVCIKESVENYKKAQEKHRNMTLNYSFFESDGFSNVSGSFDAITINVNPDFILANVKNIHAHTKNGGYFLTGSVTLESQGDIVDEFKKYSFEKVYQVEKNGWLGVAFRKLRGT